MFGRKRKLEQHILTSGVRTRAVVLDATKVSSHGSSEADLDGLRSTWSLYNVELKVTAEDGGQLSEAHKASLQKELDAINREYSANTAKPQPFAGR